MNMGDMKMINQDRITLKTFAKDNYGHSYPAYLERGRYSKALVLRFDGAPSGWDLNTLRSNRSDRIAIDFGQDWICVNYGEIASEIRDLTGMGGF